MDGFIKLHRKILENPIVCKDADYFSVWLYLLLNATHKEYPSLFKGEKVILQPGQLITGRYVIAKQFNISDSKVKRILIDFESDRQIDRQRSNQNSLITILNWSLYQQRDRQDDQLLTDNCPTSDRPVTTNKNVKNVKNEITKEIKPLKDKNIVFFPTDEVLNQAFIDFTEFRKKKKSPMTEKAIDLMIKKLASLTSSNDEKIEILNQSIMSGWTGVFPLNKSNQKPDFKQVIKEWGNE